MAKGKISRYRDPLPAFGTQDFSLGLKLLGYQPVEQPWVLQPAAIILLKQIPHDRATGGLVSSRANKQSPSIGRPNGALGKLATDQVRFLAVGPRHRIPNLLLARMIGGNP